jgi:deoxyribodipyrimidine photo-lyase
LTVPALRIQVLNDTTVNPRGDFVLYWMTAFRRVAWNFALDEAADWSRKLQKPLVILEALRCDYPWASDRLHRFILDGMEENGCVLGRSGVLYYPYVEPARGAGKGLLAALADQSCVVVTDSFPAFFLPRMLKAARAKIPVRLIAVDGNGLLPLRTAEQVFPTAFSFRRFLQKTILHHLSEFPRKSGLSATPWPAPPSLPPAILRRWPPARLAEMADAAFLAGLPIDHSVPAAPLRGGTKTGRTIWKKFLRERLSGYSTDRNHPDADATSGLSPYLHFGHLSPHEIIADLLGAENWSPDVSRKPSGSRSGWWGVGQSAEAFLDQLICWRELGFNLCSRRDDPDAYESLPDWALRTLSDHAGDPRPHRYPLARFEEAATHDPLWNAAQTQLVREGRLHNYLRMLWGKKILEWSASPQEALWIMIHLNNKYALDGRDPNSSSGIFWILGRYDRPWGPERPIFGKVRYMSSENTLRKLRVTEYLKTYRP